jgi:N-acetylglucosaminyl-diphospho-decaprenol L-rhamnosyltransferase
MDAGVVVVDNHSEDGSADTIEAWLVEHDEHGMVKLVRSPDNRGFSAGNNLGIRAWSARFYLLLNSDTLVRPGAMAALMDTAGRFPEAGLLSPRLEWPNGEGQESCFRFTHRSAN